MLVLMFALMLALNASHYRSVVEGLEVTQVRRNDVYRWLPSSDGEFSPSTVDAGTPKGMAGRLFLLRLGIEIKVKEFRATMRDWLTEMVDLGVCFTSFVLVVFLFSVVGIPVILPCYCYFCGLVSWVWHVLRARSFEEKLSFHRN